MIAVILAAGSAKRFGQSKLSYIYKDKPILNYVIDHLGALSDSMPIYVVTGDHKDKIESIISERVQESVHNPDYDKGQGTSVKVAIELAKELKQDLLLTLGDLPLVSTEDYRKLVNFYVGKPLFSKFADSIGPPCLIPFKVLNEFEEIPANKGIKAILSEFETVEIPSAEKDIDVMSDLT
jgi:molybdenum cofactor cytidylyltransferase